MFTVGDNSTVGGYLNGPLSGGSKYAIFVRYFASSPFVARQYDVFVSTGFLAVQLCELLYITCDIRNESMTCRVTYVMKA